MTNWTIVLAHTGIDQLEESLNQLALTAVCNSELVIVDHHWPLDQPTHSRKLVSIAHAHKAHLLRPFENLGGHGGLGWTLSQLPLGRIDRIIVYDPDSNPTERGWDEAAFDVLKADESLAGVFLNLQQAHDAPGRTWRDEQIAGRTVSFCSDYSVTNVAIMRSIFYLDAPPIQTPRRFYGFIENWVWEECKRQGKRVGYLKDFWEAPSPIAQHPLYTAWKLAHAHHRPERFDGNFEQFVRERLK